MERRNKNFGFNESDRICFYNFAVEKKKIFRNKINPSLKVFSNESEMMGIMLDYFLPV